MDVFRYRDELNLDASWRYFTKPFDTQLRELVHEAFSSFLLRHSGRRSLPEQVRIMIELEEVDAASEEIPIPPPQSLRDSLKALLSGLRSLPLPGQKSTIVEPDAIFDRPADSEYVPVAVIRISGDQVGVFSFEGGDLALPIRDVYLSEVCQRYVEECRNDHLVEDVSMFQSFMSIQM